MAMPVGRVVVPEKMQFLAAGGGGGGNEIHRHQQWFPVVDERDWFISWLRGEFAAANAIIDSLCHHLGDIGERGEYDLALGCIERRRCNWHSVLHMQQFFPVEEVIQSLQQVTLRKQQHHHRVYYDQGKMGKDSKRSYCHGGFNEGQRVSEVVVKETVNSSIHSLGNGVADGNASANLVGSKKIEESQLAGYDAEVEDKGLALPGYEKELVADSHSNISTQRLGASSGAYATASDAIPTENNLHPVENQNKKPDPSVSARTFFCPEMIDGKMVNTVDGLILYEQLLDAFNVANLVSLVNDLRATGRKGELHGRTYMVLKRPMKGRGREVIQLGHAIADAPLEDESTDRRVEHIPTLLQDVIDRLASMQLMTMKPDSCIIDIFNEGDHSQPYTWPPWFAKPVYILLLTKCDMTLGRMIVSDHPGDYRGSLKLDLEPGSFIEMQGNPSGFTKHALPGMQKQRILITFAKWQSRKFGTNDRLQSTWSPPVSRSPKPIRHIAPKHYPTAPATGVLPAPSTRPPPDGVQPLFVAAPVATHMLFPVTVPTAPGSTGWHTPPPTRHPAPPRALVPVPGTGVFLPPPDSPSNAPPATQLSLNATGADFPPEEENGHETITSSTEEKLGMKSHECGCNGITKRVEMAEDEQQHSIEHAPGN